MAREVASRIAQPRPTVLAIRRRDDLDCRDARGRTCRRSGHSEQGEYAYEPGDANEGTFAVRFASHAALASLQRSNRCRPANFGASADIARTPLVMFFDTLRARQLRQDTGDHAVTLHAAELENVALG